MSSFPFSFWRLDPLLNGGGGGLGINYGYEFDGVDETINFGNVLDHDGTESWSISFWVKGIINSDWIISKQSVRYQGLEIFSDGNRKLAISFGRTSTDRIACNTTNAINLNEWNHCLITYDGSKTVAGVKMYLNNVEETLITTRDTWVGSSANSGDLSFGSIPWSTNNWLNGRLDDVQYYDFVLNSSQVSDIYDNGYVTVPTASPIHHWKMGEDDTWDGSNWTVNDSVGSLNGTSVNMEELDRKLGVAYSAVFNGTDEFITHGNVLDNDGSNPISFSCWVNSNSDDAELFAKISVHLGFAVHVLGRYVYFRMGATSGDRIYCRSNTLRTTTSSWNFITVTYDGSKSVSGVKFYIDGVQESATSITDNFTSSSSNSYNLEIGKRDSLYFDGVLMRYAVHNKELSQAEVTELYNIGIPILVGDTSLASADIDCALFGTEDTATTIKDYSNNAYDGTLVNMDLTNKSSLTP